MIWEVFTNGSQPYEDLDNEKVIDEVSKGKYAISASISIARELFIVRNWIRDVPDLV